MGHDVIAERFDGLAGNASSTHLISCRQTMSGARNPEPGQQVVEPLPDRVDVQVAIRMRVR